MNYSQEVQKAAASGHKIAAIKLLREETGMDLKEAKHAIEDLQRSLGIQPSAETGSGGIAGLLEFAAFFIACFLLYRYFTA